MSNCLVMYGVHYVVIVVEVSFSLYSSSIKDIAFMKYAMDFYYRKRWSEDYATAGISTLSSLAEE